jgi:hypothetical protein
MTSCAAVLSDDFLHLGDFRRQVLLVEKAIRDIAVEGIERAETIAGIRTTQILLHLPDRAASGHDEGAVDIARKLNTVLTVLGLEPSEHVKRVEPHREIMEILPVAVSLLADSDAALSTKHTHHLGDQRLAIIEKTLILQ